MKPCKIKAVPDSWALSVLIMGNVTVGCAFLPYVCFRWCAGDGWVGLHVFPWPWRGHVPLERRKCLHHWGWGHSQQSSGADGCGCVWCVCARWSSALYIYCIRDYIIAMIVFSLTFVFVYKCVYFWLNSLLDKHLSSHFIPGVEGKAGMAAIADISGSFDSSSFLQKIQRALPPYARPVFLRISPHVDTTGKFLNNSKFRKFSLIPDDFILVCIFILCISLSLCTVGTFKIQKTRLQREGYDPRLTTDRIYLLNTRAVQYDAVDEELYSAIVEGRISLWHGSHCRAA